MGSPTVIIDLSTVARGPYEDADWKRIEALVDAWREQQDSQAVFYGVADNSLWHHLDAYGKRELNDWQRRGMAECAPFADPMVCELAEQHPQAVILSSDKYRDQRKDFPFLQGCERVFTFVVDEDLGVSITHQPLLEIPDSEVSRYAEQAEQTPKNLKSVDGRRLLDSEWSCRNPECVWSETPAIEEFPMNVNGIAHCPVCDLPLTRLGKAMNTVELKLLIDGATRHRITIPEGTKLVLGRGGGDNRFDVRRIMTETDANRISRDHIEVINQAGRLGVTDLKSRNGSTLCRVDGLQAKLASDVRQMLSSGDRLALPGGLEIVRSGKSQPRGTYVADRSPMSAPEQTRMADS